MRAANVRGKGSARLAGPTAKDQRPPRARLGAVQLNEEEEIPAVGGGVHRRGGVSATSERDDTQGHNEAGKHGPHRTRRCKNNCSAGWKGLRTLWCHMSALFMGNPCWQCLVVLSNVTAIGSSFLSSRRAAARAKIEVLTSMPPLTHPSCPSCGVRMISNSGGNPRGTHGGSWRQRKFVTKMTPSPVERIAQLETSPRATKDSTQDDPLLLSPSYPACAPSRLAPAVTTTSPSVMLASSPLPLTPRASA